MGGDIADDCLILSINNALSTPKKSKEIKVPAPPGSLIDLMKQRPKGFIFALSGKDNKPVQRFQAFSTETDYSSARRIHAINKRFDDNDTPDNDVLDDISDTDGSNERADIVFIINDKTTDDDTSDIDDRSHMMRSLYLISCLVWMMILTMLTHKVQLVGFDCAVDYITVENGRHSIPYEEAILAPSAKLDSLLTVKPFCSYSKKVINSNVTYNVSS